MLQRVESSRNNTIAIQLGGTNWDVVQNVNVDCEGHRVYPLSLGAQKVADCLLVEVTVKDNLKIITLRSVYKLDNQTLFNIDVVLVDSEGQLGDPVTIGEPYHYCQAHVIITDAL